MASTIKVDNVQNQPGNNLINRCSATTTIGSGAGNTVVVCGSTVTLGRCSGTVALATGATQTGFGRTGTVDWITTAKVTGDSPVTGVSGKGYFMNTAGGTITLNLPAGSAGDIVSVQDYNNTFDTHFCKLNPNGSEKINGGAGTITLSAEGEGLTLVYVDGTVGWRSIEQSTFTAQGEQLICASVSGACNTLTTVDTNYKVATFFGPGNFTVNSGAGPVAVADYTVVAGGGSGGRGGSGGDMGGGGGAGGFREAKVVATSGCWTASPLAAATSVPLSPGAYPITVGAGGAATPSSAAQYGNPGSNSIFSSITSTGGGGGASNASTPGFNPPSYPGAGGSGGGARGGGAPTLQIGTGNSPPVSPPQGNPGGWGSAGAGPNPFSPDNSAGAGGGAAAVGGNSSAPSGGVGGAGATNTITGSPVQRAGGGGGAGNSGPGGGGAGGGGAGGWDTTPGTAGTANTGGGGGGNGCNGSGTGKAGGSGIVVIRYKFQ